MKPDLKTALAEALALAKTKRFGALMTFAHDHGEQLLAMARDTELQNKIQQVRALEHEIRRHVNEDGCACCRTAGYADRLKEILE